MMRSRILIFLKKNNQQIYGPYTPKMMIKILDAPNDFLEWIWYEPKKDWSPIEKELLEEWREITKTITKKVKPTKKTEPFLPTSTSTLRHLEIPSFKILCKFRNKIFNVTLDHIHEGGCILFDIQEKNIIPEHLIGAQLMLNILDIKTNVAENVPVTVLKFSPMPTDPTALQFFLQWEKCPKIFHFQK